MAGRIIVPQVRQCPDPQNLCVCHLTRMKTAEIEMIKIGDGINVTDQQTLK